MTSDRQCPCCEEPIESNGCGCGPSLSDAARRRRTSHTDDDLVIGLNDMRMVEDDRLADAS